MSFLSRNGAVLSLEHFMTSDSTPGSFSFNGESYKYTLSRNSGSYYNISSGNIFNAMDENPDTFSGGITGGIGANIIPFSITFDKPLTLMSVAYKILIGRAASWYGGPLYKLEYNNGNTWITLLDSSLPESGKTFELNYTTSPNFINNIYGIRICITASGAYTSLYDMKLGFVSPKYKSVFDLPLITNTGTILDDGNCINTQKSQFGTILEPSITGNSSNYLNGISLNNIAIGHNNFSSNAGYSINNFISGFKSIYSHNGIKLSDAIISKKNNRILTAITLDNLSSCNKLDRSLDTFTLDELLNGNKSEHIKIAVILKELLANNKTNRILDAVLQKELSIGHKAARIFKGVLLDDFIIDRFPIIKSGPLIDNILCGKRKRLKNGYILNETLAFNHEKKYGYVFIM